MIAVAASLLVVAYLLFPSALFRFVLGRFVPLRAFQENKTEEMTRAAVTLIIIYALAVAFVWYVPILRSHPFGFADSSGLKRADYQLVASGIYSEPIFKDSGPRFWDALERTAWRQGRFLTWYYSLVVVFGLLAVAAIRYYGRFRNNKLYFYGVRFLVLPYVSQWYALLTPFLFSDKKLLVNADILMTDGVLYRGTVVDYSLDKESNLSGLILEDPVRFDRAAYLKERDEWGTTRRPNNFWRRIPSAKLYLVADKILNLNFNYESPKAAEASLQRELLKESPQTSLKFSITIGGRQQND